MDDKYRTILKSKFSLLESIEEQFLLNKSWEIKKNNANSNQYKEIIANMTKLLEEKYKNVNNLEQEC